MANKNITIYPGISKLRPQPSAENGFENFLNASSLKVIPFSCARAAMVYGIRVLGLNRMDEILVPPYTPQCVLSALSRAAFPAMQASEKTRAIMVFHQFGFPQNMHDIAQTASSKGWAVINNCAHALYANKQEPDIWNQGDFSVVSFGKFYFCGLGGGFFSKDPQFFENVEMEVKRLNAFHSKKAEEALKTLVRHHDGQLSEHDDLFEIQSLFGYLPEIVALPDKASLNLPQTISEWEIDANHRRQIWRIVREALPGNVPQKAPETLSPFAVPIRGEEKLLREVSNRIRTVFGFEAPILHFDFYQNMLDPDYQKSLVIGCHQKWTLELVKKICEWIKDESLAKV